MARSTPVKPELRRDVIARRDAIPAAELARIAAGLTARLEALPQFRAARSVLATMSIGSEWSTRAFIEGARAAGKTVVLPRISAPARPPGPHAVPDLQADLVPGVWNIPEPDPPRFPRVALSEVDF